jgi:hypothetical protein
VPTNPFPCIDVPKNEARLRGVKPGFRIAPIGRGKGSGMSHRHAAETISLNSVCSGPSEGLFHWRSCMPRWRNEYRRCDTCRREYRPQREAQSYCSPDCRRAAAYGRERFKAGTRGRRRRRLEASGKLPGTLVAASFRNEVFSSIEPIPCKATKPAGSSAFDQWPRCKVCKRWELLPHDDLPRHMFCIAVRKVGGRKEKRPRGSRDEAASHLTPSTQHWNDGGSQSAF